MLERLLEILGDAGADLEGAVVVGVVVAGAEGVGPDHDAALDLGAEALFAAFAEKFNDVADRLGGAVAEVDAVVAGEVTGGFAGRDDVVGGDAVVGVGKLNIDNLGSVLLQNLEGVVKGTLHLRLDTPRGLGGFGELTCNADAQVFRAAFDKCVDACEEVGHFERRAGRIERIMAANGLQHQRGILDGPGHRADLVERGGEGDQAVAADAAVGGLDADQAAEGRGLADAAAGVAAETGTGHSRRDGSGASTAASAWNTVDVPRISRNEKRAVFRRGTHREFIEIRLAHDDRAGGFELLDNRRVVRRVEVFEHPARTGGGAAAEAHVVLERDRHARQRPGNAASVHVGRPLQRVRGILRDEGVDAAVNRRDSRQRLTHQFDGGNVPSTNGVASGDEGVGLHQKG